jgi:Cu2+-exporting ATPase
VHAGGVLVRPADPGRHAPRVVAGARRAWTRSPAASILLAYGASVVETLRGGPQVWFDAAAMFVLFLLLARVLERMRATAPASAWSCSRARNRTGLARARRALEQVPVLELQVGDEAAGAGGRNVPPTASARRRREFDEALLSGESAPVRKRRGDAVLAGSRACLAGARLRVTAVGADTRLAQLQALVQDAQERRPALARSADRAARAFVLLMFGAALAASGGGCRRAPASLPDRAAVLVAACPARSRWRCRRRSRPPPTRSRAAACWCSAPMPSKAWRKSTPCCSTRPARSPRARRACARCRPSRRRGRARAGGGTGTGQPASARARLRLRPPASRARATCTRAAASRAIAMARACAWAAPISPPAASTTMRSGSGAMAGAGRFEIEHALRADAGDAVARLQALGLRVQVASGDAADAVARACAQLGIEDWEARLLPPDKLALLRGCRQAGTRVLAVGDGLNDAPLLAGADVAAAIGAAPRWPSAAPTCCWPASASRRSPTPCALARRARRIMRQNLAWAAGYNLVAIALAASGMIAPGWAALGMAGSSLGVTSTPCAPARTRRSADDLPARAHPGRPGAARRRRARLRLGVRSGQFEDIESARSTSSPTTSARGKPDAA